MQNQPRLSVIVVALTLLLVATSSSSNGPPPARMSSTENPPSTSGNSNTSSQSKFIAYNSSDTPIEQQIHELILSNYSAEVKPDASRNLRRLSVLFEMKITKLNSLDVKQQELSITAFTLLSWFDRRLVWDPEQYEDHRQVNLKNDKIWTPDVLLYNDADDGELKTHTDVYKSKLQVQHTGRVVWNNPVRWVSSCEVDVTWFPIDEQVCNMTFGSWSYNENQLHLSFKKKISQNKELVSDNFLIDSGEWSITGIETYEEVLLFDCCSKGFSTITYVIHMRRYPLFYFIYIFLPLISQLLLFLIIFHIPPDTGERLGFGITILLNITMYMVLISEKLPEKSDQYPLLGLLFVALFYLLSAGIAASAFTMLLSRKTTDVPAILKRVFFRKVILGKGSSTPPTNDCITKKQLNTSESSKKELDFTDSVIVKPRSLSEDLSSSESVENWSNLVKIFDRILFYLFLMFLITIPVVIYVLLIY